MPIIKTKRSDILRRKEIEEMLKVSEPWLQCLIGLLWIFGKRITENLKLQRDEIGISEDKKYLWVRFHVGKKRKNKDRPYLKRITLKHPGTPYILSYIETIKDGPLFNVSRQLALYYLKKVNPKTYFHYFRHSLATEMAEHGATEEKLMSWFDWDSPDIAHDYVKHGTKLTEEYSERTW